MIHAYFTALIFTITFPGSVSNNHLCAVTYQLNQNFRSQKENFKLFSHLDVCSGLGTVFPPESMCWRLGPDGGGVEACEKLGSRKVIRS